jgi:hypothetical protein
MANKKNKSKRKATMKTAKKQARSRPKRRKTSGGNSLGNLAHKICSITDPFCNGAIGSKLPDSTTSKTLSWDAEMWLNLNTNADGHSAIIFGTDPSAAYAYSATWNGTTNEMLTSSAAFPLPGWSDFSTASPNWRVVSFGVEAYSTLSAMDNAGYLGVAVVPAEAEYIPVGMNLDSASNFANNVRVPMRNGELTAVSHHDAVEQKKFKDSGHTLAQAMFTGGAEAIVVYASGTAVSAPVAQVKVTYHYELIFPKTGIFNSLATPAALEDSKALAGNGYVSKVVEQVIQGGKAEVEKRTMAAASIFGRMLVQGAAGAAGAYFGGPTGAIAGAQMAGMIMDVD